MMVVFGDESRTKEELRVDLAVTEHDYEVTDKAFTGYYADTKKSIDKLNKALDKIE